LRLSNTIILLLAVCFCLGLAACNKVNESTVAIAAMTMKSNILMSGEADNPPVNNYVQTITLQFSEPLDAKTVQQAVKLYKIDPSGKPGEEPSIVKINLDNPLLLDINNLKVENFPEGEEYKIAVSRNLKSTSGHALENDFSGYFATNHNFAMTGNPDLNNVRSQIVIISDMHLGLDDSYAQIGQNKPALVDFLKQIRNSPNVKELVINGDLFDEWWMPMDFVMPPSESALVDAIAANNQTVVEAFNGIITDGNIKVTYLPGNHDMLVTEADIQRILPGINQARDAARGLGTYITGTKSEIAIEHGHRYNFFCAPDAISNRNITQNNSSILPPAYFYVRIAASAAIEGHPSSGNNFQVMTASEKDQSQFGYYLYGKIWEMALSQASTKEPLAAKVIKTNIDGFTQDYAINDLIPQQDPVNGIIDVNLFKGIQDTWEERQTLNGVEVHIPIAKAIKKSVDDSFTDSLSKTEYFDQDAARRIVVFGHTHKACILPFTNLAGQNTIYVNDGTWLENALGYPTMTFVVITPPTSDSAVESVNVYKYSANKTINQWEDAQIITLR
jgi:UDP-2,3-diacylglucosamine pyrophosphatase LpxH